jgi:hypothetical protein
MKINFKKIQRKFQILVDLKIHQKIQPKNRQIQGMKCL